MSSLSEARNSGRQQDGDPPHRREGDEPLSGFTRRFGEALREGDPATAESVAGKAVDAGHPVEEIYSHMITPAMEEIGRLWQRGELSIGGEHLATAISQGVMARLFPLLLDSEERTRHRVMLAATQGEHHVLGLKMMADTLEGAGYDVLYLGADVPLEALLEACRSHSPAVLGLATSMWLNVPTMLWEIGEIGKLEDPPAIMVGGRAVGRAAEEGLQVPVVEDCEHVVEVVETLIDAPSPQAPVRPSLASRVPQRPSGLIGHGDETLADLFSVTSLAAADTAREAARKEFSARQLANRDALTGLWNRRAFDDRIALLCEGTPPLGAALMIDVDNFKTVNDTHGHDAGDEALIAIGRAILTSIRHVDFGARFGGDEFVVLLPGMSADDAAVVAERIRTAVEDEPTEPPVTVSIGVAGLSDDMRKTTLLVDEALYEAKQAGRNRVAGAGV